MMKPICLLFIAYLFNIGITNAQRITVIDQKGTKKPIGNIVTAATTAPTPPIINDVWFDTTNNNTKVWDGTTWKKMISDHIGNIKYGVQPTDHMGWILLDGRAISILTATQQAQAIALGFSTNLPDATNSTLMQSSTGAIGSLGGTDSIQITQQNLPNITFTGGATSQNGDHNHTHSDKHASNIKYGSGDKTRVGKTALTSVPTTTTSNGDHNHIVNIPSGGNDVPIDITQQFLRTNIFIFLGN